MLATPYTDRLVSPSVVEAAELRQRNFDARLKGRRPTKHADTVAGHPHRILHHYRSVPPKVYFARRAVSPAVYEICVADRSGTPTGRSFRVGVKRYNAVVERNKIFPVLIDASGDQVVFYLSGDQWNLLVRLLTKPDANAPRRRPVEAVPTRLEAISGKRFNSFDDLAAAFHFAELTHDIQS